MSKENGWICMNCGRNFESPVDYGSRTYWDPPEWGCPYCKDEWIIEGYYNCEECDKDCEKEDMESEWCCKECADKAFQALNDYLDYGKPITDKTLARRIKDLVEEFRDEH